MTQEEIIREVRMQIAGAIEDDLSNSEALMKEVYERLEGDAEFEICYGEMKRIIQQLRSTDPR